jgi:hypothetical protein
MRVFDDLSFDAGFAVRHPKNWWRNHFKYHLKRAWSRVKHGYDVEALYSIPDYFTPLFVEILDRYVERPDSVPYGLTVEQWSEILCNIRDGFKAAQVLADLNWMVYTDGVYDKKASDEKYRELNYQMKKGMRFFSKWYLALWT